MLVWVLLIALVGYGLWLAWKRMGRPPVEWSFQREALKTCPHLGLAAQPFQHAGQPDDQHRCYANLARERIDRGHQQRFCLSTAYRRCPFLAMAPREDGLIERARAWFRSVSPGLPALAISQPGLRPWLGALAARLKARPAIHEPVTHERVIHELVAEEPLIEEPVNYEPVIYQPVIDTPVVEEPVITSVTDVMETPGVMLNLVTAGIAALEAGDEAEAHRLFTFATESDQRDVSAWFWRAKTSQTLDEVVDCLQNAAVLDPHNVQIGENLRRAQQRLEVALAGPIGQPVTTEVAPDPLPEGLRGPRPKPLVMRLMLNLVSAALAFGAFAMAAAWLLTALPAEMLQSIPFPGILDGGLGRATRLTNLIHFSLAGGYDLGSALPFGIGFLAVFIGIGLLNRERWTAVWAPVLALATVYQMAG